MLALQGQMGLTPPLLKFCLSFSRTFCILQPLNQSKRLMTLIKPTQLDKDRIQGKERNIINLNFLSVQVQGILNCSYNLLLYVSEDCYHLILVRTLLSCEMMYSYSQQFRVSDDNIVSCKTSLCFSLHLSGYPMTAALECPRLEIYAFHWKGRYQELR